MFLSWRAAPGMRKCPRCAASGRAVSSRAALLPTSPAQGLGRHPGNSLDANQSQDQNVTLSVSLTKALVISL